MKTRNFLIFLFLMTFLTVLADLEIAEDIPIQSIWAADPLVIDGFTIDWQDVPSRHEKKAKANYSFMNDENHLYILLTLSDLNYVNQIRLTGITIWLNTEDSKAKKLGMKFFSRTTTAEELITLLEKSEPDMSEEQKALLRKKGPFVTNQGTWINKKLGQLEVTHLYRDRKPATYRAAVSSNAVTYEMRIPIGIKELWGGPEDEIKKSLKVGFEWGGTTKEMKSAMMRDRAERATGASGGATEFRTNDDGRDEAPIVGEMNLPFKKGLPKKAFWVNIELSRKK